MLTVEFHRWIGIEHITEIDLKNLEKNYGWTLPEDYRSFLLQHNGGSPSPRSIAVEWRGKPITVQIQNLYPLSEGEVGPRLSPSFVSITSHLPNDFLAIGCDTNENQLLLRLQEPHRGAIYLWNPNEKEFPISSESMTLVAASFKSFLESLH